MAASSDTGSQTYWFNGLPAEGLDKTGNDPGTQKFWLDGLPAEYIFPVTVVVTRVSTLPLLGVG